MDNKHVEEVFSIHGDDSVMAPVQFDTEEEADRFAAMELDFGATYRLVKHEVVVTQQEPKKTPKLGEQ